MKTPVRNRYMALLAGGLLLSTGSVSALPLDFLQEQANPDVGDIVNTLYYLTQNIGNCLVYPGDTIPDCVARNVVNAVDRILHDI